VISGIPAKVWRTLLWTVAACLLLEGALQARAHFRYGTSVVNVAASQTTYVFNETFQIKTLRPDAVIQGSQSTIETNSLGLRSPKVPVAKAPDEVRVVILGASTVMGTYTRNNSDTLSYRLQSRLERLLPGRTVSVINAGIAGAALGDQANMLERLVLPRLQPDLIIWYPGFNDVAAYCRRTAPAGNATTKPAVFQAISLPSWLLSVELLTKNTVWLRTARAGKSDALDVAELDTAPFLQGARSLIDIATSAHVPMLVLTNARAFQRDMPAAQQEALSETARYYNACFDLAGLHDVFDRHNDLLIEAATRQGVPALRFDRQMPGGPDNFGDATHFSIAGTDRAAALIEQAIIDKQLLAPGAHAQ